MKDIIGYLRWTVSNWDITDRLYWGGITIVFIGLFLPEPTAWYIITIGVTCLLISFVKGLVWESLKRSYGRYKDERNKLFNTIKESDK
jgi:hypothetical protein